MFEVGFNDCKDVWEGCWMILLGNRLSGFSVRCSVFGLSGMILELGVVGSQLFERLLTVGCLKLLCWKAQYLSDCFSIIYHTLYTPIYRSSVK